MPQPYAMVHPNDLEAVTIVDPKPQGPWIAGGACLRWYQGQAVGRSDLDIFFANEAQLTETYEHIRSWGRSHVKHQSDNAITLEYNSKHNTWNLQLIKKRYYKSIQEVIDNFDITVCQIGTDGKTWTMNPNTAKDIRERNLCMRMPLQPDALKRLTKYWTYGYRPVPGLVEAVRDNPMARWEFDAMEDYN